MLKLVDEVETILESMNNDLKNPLINPDFDSYIDTRFKLMKNVTEITDEKISLIILFSSPIKLAPTIRAFFLLSVIICFS